MGVWKRFREWYGSRGILFGCAALLLGVMVFLRFVFPYVAQAAVGAPNTLPIPRTLYLWYMVVIVAAIVLYVLSSDGALADFLEPFKRAARGDATRRDQILFKVAFAFVPIIVAIGVYSTFVTKAELPSVSRTQHPGMSSSSAAPYQGKPNPFNQPSAAMLADFKSRYEAMEEPEDIYDSRPPRQDLSKLDDEQLFALFQQDAIQEGRDLYVTNCIPCHGPKLDGTGHSSYAWTLTPIDFREAGTIETLVEDSVFWRVSEGGIGLPPVATPWDSTMPRWKTDLSEQQIWKVIMAMYVDAGVEPRVLEFRQDEGGEGAQ
jgi:mono/diheme cytochrome c family protein